MKKIFLTLLLCLTLVSLAQSQFLIGVNAGVPVGDASDLYVFSAGADAYYMFGEPDALLKLGATAGFINYFGDDTEVLGQTYEFDDVQFVPVALAGRVTLISTFLAGADVGYGIALTDGVDGGFYWRLLAGLDIANNLQLNAFYHNISFDTGIEGDNSNTISNVGLQLLLEFASSDN